MDEQATGASGTRLKVATRPATVGATWLDLFHPGTPSRLSLEARVRVIADIAGALIQIHDNSGIPRQHRRHGRLTPRHLLIGVDGSASLFTTKEPFSKLLPPQPDLGYLAPELLTQLGPANQQSDVFSMGVLLWEALDNGRLFPHRRAAAISRLIARRSLPTPRIEEEWAMPLAEVAMKALSNDPDERYANATAFWLALREHLPAPDTARAALSLVVQRALKLELTTEIRDNPPYIVPSRILLTTTVPPGRGSALDAPSPETSARYSLNPEPSSRHPGASRSPTPPPSDDAAGSLSDGPPRSSRPGLHSEAERISPVPEARTRAQRAPGQHSPDLEPPPSRTTTGTQPSTDPALATPPRSVQLASEPPISTLHVNLPRDLVDSSLPFYVSSQPAPRPFPWGALTFSALMFFGVGAAVAFGAVTALRSAPESVRRLAWPSVVTPRPTPATVIAPAAPTPQAPELGGDPSSTAPSAKIETPSPAPATEAADDAPQQTERAKPTSTRATPGSARPSPRRAGKSTKSKATTSKSTTPPGDVAPAKAPAAPSETKAPASPSDVDLESDEGLPFVEQPY